jgi:hypothetical protein
MKTKRKLICSAVFGCALAGLAIVAFWQMADDSVDLEVLATWRAFGNHVRSGELPAAYNMLTRSEQAKWSFEMFTNSAIIAVSPGLLGLPVTRYRHHPILGKTTFLAGGETLTLPLWLEDGFMVAEVTMWRQDGKWKLELPIVNAR